MGRLLETSDTQTNTTGGKYRIYTPDGWVYGNHSFGLALAMTKTPFYPVLNALEIEGLVEKTPKYTIRLYSQWGGSMGKREGNNKRVLVEKAQEKMPWLTQAVLMSSAYMSINY